MLQGLGGSLLVLNMFPMPLGTQKYGVRQLFSARNPRFSGEILDFALVLDRVLSLRHLVYWGPSIWKLLYLENTRFNVAGFLILLYSALCILWIWPMVVGCFISALREGHRNIRKSKTQESRKMELTIEALVDFFEELVGDSPERFISRRDRRDGSSQLK